MKHVNRKLAALISFSILAGLLILLNSQIHALPLQTPVDVAVTSITDVDGMIIYFSGANKTAGTNLTIDVTVERAIDTSGVTTLYVNVTLNRMNVAMVSDPRTRAIPSSAMDQLDCRLNERMVRHRSGRKDNTVNLVSTLVSNRNVFVFRPVK